MIDTKDSTLPNRLKAKREAFNLLNMLNGLKGNPKKFEKAYDKLTNVQRDQISILEDLSAILEQNQDMAYVLGRNLIETGINSSFIPDHYVKLLPLMILNKKVEEYISQEKLAQMELEKEKANSDSNNTNAGGNSQLEISKLLGKRMITKLMDKMKREEEIQNSTYENLYTSLLKKNEIDKIHQIINTFILKWFPQETNYDSDAENTPPRRTYFHDSANQSKDDNGKYYIFFRLNIDSILEINKDEKLKTDDRDESLFDYLHTMANFDLSRKN